MKCPECQSTHVNKNGQKKGKQNYICVCCGRQFIDCYQPHKGYSEEVKRECLKMYVNGMGFRAIERIKGVHHTSIINWVKQVGELGVAELRYDLWDQGMFWLPNLPRLSAIEMIRWIGNRNLPKLKIMNY